MPQAEGSFPNQCTIKGVALGSLQEFKLGRVCLLWQPINRYDEYPECMTGDAIDVTNKNLNLLAGSSLPNQYHIKYCVHASLMHLKC